MNDISEEQAKYIDKFYRKYGDNKLGRALGRPKSWVKQARSALSLHRNDENRSYIHAHPR